VVTGEVTGDRANQKIRTRRAIIDACRDLVRSPARWCSRSQLGPRPGPQSSQRRRSGAAFW